MTGVTCTKETAIIPTPCNKDAALQKKLDSRSVYFAPHEAQFWFLAEIVNTFCIISEKSDGVTHWLFECYSSTTLQRDPNHIWTLKWFPKHFLLNDGLDGTSTTRISTLKSCLSVLPTSYRKRFQLVFRFYLVSITNQLPLRHWGYGSEDLPWRATFLLYYCLASARVMLNTAASQLTKGGGDVHLMSHQ